MAIRFEGGRPVSRTRTTTVSRRKRKPGEKGAYIGGEFVTAEEQRARTISGRIGKQTIIKGVLRKKMEVTGEGKPPTPTGELAEIPTGIEKSKVAVTSFETLAPLKLQLRGLPQTTSVRVAERARLRALTTGPATKQPLPTQFAEGVDPVSKGLIGKLSDVTQKTFKFDTGETIIRQVTTEPLTLQEAKLREHDILAAQKLEVAERIQAGDTRGVVFEPTRGEILAKNIKRNIKNILEPGAEVLGKAAFETTTRFIPKEAKEKPIETLKLPEPVIKTGVKFATVGLGLIKREKAIRRAKEEERFMREFTPEKAKKLQAGIRGFERQQDVIKDITKIQRKKIKKIDAQLREKIPFESGRAGEKTRAAILKLPKFKGRRKTARFVGGAAEALVGDVKTSPLKTIGKFGAGVAVTTVAGPALGAFAKVGRGPLIATRLFGGLAGATFVGGKAIQIALTPGIGRKGAVVGREIPFIAGLAAPRIAGAGVRVAAKVGRVTVAGARAIPGIIPKQVKVVGTPKQIKFARKILGADKLKLRKPAFPLRKIGAPVRDFAEVAGIKPMPGFRPPVPRPVVVPRRAFPPKIKTGKPDVLFENLLKQRPVIGFRPPVPKPVVGYRPPKPPPRVSPFKLIKRGKPDVLFENLLKQPSIFKQPSRLRVAARRIIGKGEITAKVRGKQIKEFISGKIIKPGIEKARPVFSEIADMAKLESKKLKGLIPRPKARVKGEIESRRLLGELILKKAKGKVSGVIERIPKRAPTLTAEKEAFRKGRFVFVERVKFKGDVVPDIRLRAAERFAKPIKSKVIKKIDSTLQVGKIISDRPVAGGVFQAAPSEHGRLVSELVLLKKAPQLPSMVLQPTVPVFKPGKPLIAGTFGLGVFQTDFRITGMDKIEKTFRDIMLIPRQIPESKVIPEIIPITGVTPTQTRGLLPAQMVRPARRTEFEQIFEPVPLEARPVTGLPEIEFTGRRRKPRRKELKIKPPFRKFQPSLTAVAFGIRGPTPRPLTGIEVRKIPIKGLF